MEFDVPLLRRKFHLLMTDASVNINNNETFTWLEPGTWRKPCIVHVTMVANGRQMLFGKLAHNGTEAIVEGKLLLLEPVESAFLNPVVRAAVEETLRRKAAAKHYCYNGIPVESQRYRFVALNEMGRILVER